MKISVAIITIFFTLQAQLPAAFAFETDQYNLPSPPLADIGDEVAEYTEGNIQKAIAKINAEIAAKQKCLEATGNCGSPQAVRQRLAYLRSEQAVARAVYNRLGYGIIAFARAGDWMNKHKFRSQPARYTTAYRKSIFVYLPTDYFTISPTVKMYGASFGTDKVAHFFQQGYTYYKIYKRASAKGASANEAAKKAVDWGKFTERTYYGSLVGGVFSNADLFANYVGMQFYQGLTKPVRIGAVTRPATLALRNGLWEFNDISRETLLTPFFTDHLNEALNPSLFIAGLRSSIRGIVKKQSCPQWRALYPDRAKEDYEAATSSLTLWHGEDYGFKTSSKFVTIANTCF